MATILAGAGLCLRGQQRPGSDIDLLVELEPGRDLFNLVELKQELEEKLHRRVDIGAKPVALHPGRSAAGGTTAVKRDKAYLR